MSLLERVGRRRRSNCRLRITLVAALTSALSIAGAWIHVFEPGDGNEAPVPAFATVLASCRARLGHLTVRKAGAVALPEDSKDLIGISTVEEFQTNIDGDVVVAMFSSPFCGPCMLVEPMIGKMAQDFKESVKILKVNLIPGQTGKALKPLFSEHSVKELPTFLVFKGGEVQGRVTGTRHAELREMIEGLI
mmetsp:Transcript_104491/g.326911  ORF Transcript_104491/g.326911 Transcript_104491/m.326911 type:complete len:191 (-) Transcript_104491:367-939(-)